jgi:sec-independent protein translocase protein TatA
MVQYFAILDLGTPGLILILLIALLLFGGKKLPELSRSIASSIRELRKGMGEGDSHEKTEPEKPKREPAA